MPNSLLTKSITPDPAALVREAQRQVAESTARVSRKPQVTIEQQVESSVASPISSKGHAGPGGQSGEKLNVVG